MGLDGLIQVDVDKVDALREETFGYIYLFYRDHWYKVGNTKSNGFCNIQVDHPNDMDNYSPLHQMDLHITDEVVAKSQVWVGVSEYKDNRLIVLRANMGIV